ncbi:uncharacterized protein LOC141723751 [Apium graveolens]|uniref:uncharacterized protein LOC141723751 n=1 Tax=Apium graveolens TaxID=4045 RepID=UPI003D79DBFE
MTKPLNQSVSLGFEFVSIITHLDLSSPVVHAEFVDMSSDQQPADNQHSADNNQQQPSPSAVGPVGWIEHHYKRLKENAETYPYVWASYAVVYVGFGLWTTYRWRKLRRTEDRVRVLQARLQKLVEADESAALKAVPERTTFTAVPEMRASNTITKAEESEAAATVTDKAAS